MSVVFGAMHSPMLTTLSYAFCRVKRDSIFQEISNRTHWTDPSTWESNSPRNFLRGPLVRSHSIFDGYIAELDGTHPYHICSLVVWFQRHRWRVSSHESYLAPKDFSGNCRRVTPCLRPWPVCTTSEGQHPDAPYYPVVRFMMRHHGWIYDDEHEYHPLWLWSVGLWRWWVGTRNIIEG